jgi:hypothetical protein
MHGARHEVTLQFRLRWLTRSALAGAVACAAALALLRLFLDAPLGPSFAGAWHAIDALRHVLLPAVGFAVLVWVLLGGAGAALLADMVAHRIAGPLLRLEHLADGLRHGELSPAPHVRHGDQLTGLAAALGDLEEALAAELREAASHAQEIEHAWEELATSPPEELEVRVPETLARIEADLAAIAGADGAGAGTFASTPDAS